MPPPAEVLPARPGPATDPGAPAPRPDRGVLSLALLALALVCLPLGLQWRDIDWARKKIHVRRSRVRDRTGTPKSGKARQVDMAPQLERVLRALQAERRRAHPWRDPDGWVFTSRDGRQPLGETVFNRAWQRLRRDFAKKRIRPLTLHSARHTWATLALRAGKSIRWTADQLGHADPAITLRIYAHSLPEESEDLGFLDFSSGMHLEQDGGALQRMAGR